MTVPARRKFLAQCLAVSALPLSSAALPRDLEALQMLKTRSQGQKIGGVFMLPATPDTTQWGWFDNAQAPVLSVRSGDTVAMETMMASSDQVRPGVPIEEITRLRLEHPGRGPHTITGPIWVEGAQPGDVLVLGKPLGIGTCRAVTKREGLSPRSRAAMIARTAGPPLILVR